MKHFGKARGAGVKMLAVSFFIMLALVIFGLIASVIGSLIVGAAFGLFVLWILFALFCLNFFRDPTPRVPSDPRAIVSPAHGTVDVIEETTDNEFMGGRCLRISIFLSVFDVHVQQAPVAGRIAYLRHCPGKFLNAMNTECSTQNENVLYGVESSERPGERIAVRLLAGLIARRIIPWINVGDVVERGERTSLIQFGSRVDLYLPLATQVQVRLGDKVKGGETVVALRD